MNIPPLKSISCLGNTVASGDKIKITVSIFLPFISCLSKEALQSLPSNVESTSSTIKLHLKDLPVGRILLV